MSYDFDVVEVHNPARLGPYEVSSALLVSGWVGGIWVRMSECRSWRDGEGIRWVRKVEVCGDTDPTFFILRGSLEATDQYTTQYPGRTGVITCCNAGQFMFKYFETVDKAERHTPGGGSPLVYTRGQTLYVSDRGYLTSEKETANSRSVGITIGIPADNENYLVTEVLFP